MKKYSLFFVLLFATSSFAQLTQDWDISPLGQKTYFERDEGYLEMYYNDSTVVFADYRKHYFGEKYYKDGFNGCYEELGDAMVYYAVEPYFDEKFFIEEWYSNSEKFFFLNGLDTINFYHKAPLNYSWQVPTSNANDYTHIQFECINILQKDILGILDSIRVYQMTALENGNVVSNFITGTNIELSKKNGFVKIFPLQKLLKNSTYLNSELFEISSWEKDGTTGGNLPRFNLFYENISAGDIFKWKKESYTNFPNEPYWYNDNSWWRDSITQVEFYPDSLLRLYFDRSYLRLYQDATTIDTTFNISYNSSKTYLPSTFSNLSNSPPGYVMNVNGDIYQLEFIKKNSGGYYETETDRNIQFGPSGNSCDFWFGIDDTFQRRYQSHLGLTYEYHWGLSVTRIEELIGWKRGNITSGDISTVVKPIPTSTKNLLKSNIKIFPNPTSDFLHFDFSNNENKIFKITIYDALGNVLLEKQKELTSSIRISNFPNGFYFVKISSSFGDVIHKFVKEK